MTSLLNAPPKSVANPPERVVPGRRRTREFTRADAITLAGSAVAASAFSWFLCFRLVQGVSLLGCGVIAYAAFLALFVVVTAEQYGRLVAVDRVATVVIASVAILAAVPLVSLLSFLTLKGVKALRPGFFVHDQRGITPLKPATAGGGSHAIVGTLEAVGLALIWSLPLGLAAAVFLNESRSAWRKPVRVFVDAMSGLPSVVAGLFIFATLILPFAKKSSLFGFNGFMASLALALTMLPTITRTVEVVLRLVPDGLREASLALGSSRARTVWSVVFPTARNGITTAVVLAIARAVGETAPLLFTSFGYDLMNRSPFRGAQESLPLFIFRNIRKPDPAAISRAYTGALVLMLTVLALFALARYIGRDRTKGNR